MTSPMNFRTLQKRLTLAKALDVPLDVLFYPDKLEEYHESLPTNDDVNHPSHHAYPVDTP